MTNKTQTIGYDKALQLLKQGEKMHWDGFSAKAYINNCMVRYDAYLKLHNVMRIYGNPYAISPTYILKEQFND